MEMGVVCLNNISSWRTTILLFPLMASLILPASFPVGSAADITPGLNLQHAHDSNGT